MSDDQDLEAREAAYLERIAQRKQQKFNQKVFGGGLEAARGGPKPVNTPAYQQPHHQQQQQQQPPRQNSQPSNYVPTHQLISQQEANRPVQHEEISLSLPPPVNRSDPNSRGHAEIVEEHLDMGLSSIDEAAAREEARIAARLGLTGNTKVSPSVFDKPNQPQPQQPKHHEPQVSRPQPQKVQPYHATHQHTPAPVQHTPAPVQQQSYDLPPPQTQTFDLPPPKPATQSSGGSYPKWSVGSLISAADSATLPISQLACQGHELHVWLKQNGKQIEFKRNVIENGQPKNETQHFNIPYQVTRQTTSATYYPNTNNGEIRIRLGKVVSHALGTEYEVCQFTVPGDRSSSQPRVAIGADQNNPDYYKFIPGPSSAFDTKFTVKLNGNNLEFHSVHEIPEGDAIKVVNGKQTVGLPFVPQADQVRTESLPGGAMAVLVYHASQSGSGAEQVVPDCEIPVVLG